MEMMTLYFRPSLYLFPATPTATNTPIPVFTRADFSYDADGNMVKAVMQTSTGTITTLFVSAMYQVRDGSVTKYYQGGAFRVGGVLYYGLSDHLGSSTVTVNPDGSTAETRYTAWGEVRYQSGTNPSDRTYTGQRSYANDFGLLYYHARWYDTQLGRFAQADSVVPSGVQGWDRYHYASNNPILFSDPTGHFSEDKLIKWFGEKWRELFDAGWQAVLSAAEFGDLIVYGSIECVLVEQKDMLVGWDLSKRFTSSPFTGIEEMASTGSGELALYRPVGVNPNGGPTKNDAVLQLGEPTSPQNGMYNGSNKESRQNNMINFLGMRVRFCNSTRHGNQPVLG